MYAVGDFVVHPGQGVCKVEEVTTGPDAKYELLPIRERHAMHISLPVTFEDKLRPVLSREEAEEILDQYPTMQVEEFEARNNSLEEQHYREEIRQGSCRDTVRIVKTFLERIEDLSSHNKKPPVAYERILKQARERSCSELAVALECSPEDVATLFETRVQEYDSQN